MQIDRIVDPINLSRLEELHHWEALQPLWDRIDNAEPAERGFDWSDSKMARRVAAAEPTPKEVEHLMQLYRSLHSIIISAVIDGVVHDEDAQEVYSQSWDQMRMILYRWEPGRGMSMGRWLYLELHKSAGRWSRSYRWDDPIQLRYEETYSVEPSIDTERLMDGLAKMLSMEDTWAEIKAFTEPEEE